jgi:transcriptional regulator of NAD metabolism
MSKVFYDNLLSLDKIDRAIKKAATTCDERMELWQVVDEIVHHRVMGCVLDALPIECHDEFLEKFSKAPYDEQLLDYLRQKVKKDVTMIIKEAVAVLVLEIATEITGKGLKSAKYV